MGQDSLDLKLENIFLTHENLTGEKNQEVLRGIHLHLPSGIIHTFLSSDPSSHFSRTALLRLIAGLDAPTSGRLLLNGEDITRLPAKARQAAMVYEEFINYPHLTVFENIASPLRVRGLYSQKDIEEKIHCVAKTLHLTPFLSRLPSQLSGGQQQRVSLARALVREARLILLDNPLANLDYKLREELREEFRQLFKQENSLILYGTADPHEALSLGGRTYILKRGQILQQGPALEVYQRPAHREVAAVVSDPPMNFLPGERRGSEWILGEGGQILGLRPQDFLKTSASPDKDNLLWLDCKVTMVEVTGMDTLVHLLWRDKFPLIWDRMGIHAYTLGQNLRVGFPPQKLFAFDHQGTLIWPA